MLPLLLMTSMVTSSPVAQGQDQRKPSKESVHPNHAVEAAPYQVITQSEGYYEARRYPESYWVCTNMTVDTSKDPLAALEDMDIFQVRESDEYKTKAPRHLMFMRLFGYLRGKNKGGVAVPMTTGGFTKHSIVTRDPQGHTELQERCFYLPKKYQAGSTQTAPTPLDPQVYIQERKELNVLVKEFPSWVFTAASWQKSHEKFLEELENKKVSDTTYYTRNSGYHWKPEAERHHDILIPEI